MPKREKRNTFDWATLKGNSSLSMKFGDFISYYKKIFYQKILQKLWPEK